MTEEEDRPGTATSELRRLTELVRSLEAGLEAGAGFGPVHPPPPPPPLPLPPPLGRDAAAASGGDGDAAGRGRTMLEELAAAREGVADLLVRRAEEGRSADAHVDADVDADADAVEEAADALLDAALAWKRAAGAGGGVGDSHSHSESDAAAAGYRCHLRRMGLIPSLRRTDAVRLLGPRRGLDSGGMGTGASDAGTGIFETTEAAGDDGGGGGGGGVCPSAGARRLAAEAGEVLRRRGYRQRNCAGYLRRWIGGGGEEERGGGRTTRTRAYGGGRYFRLRHEEEAARGGAGEDEGGNDAVRLLARLLLFGLAVGRDECDAVLGGVDLDALVRAGLLGPAGGEGDPLLVGEVQIYPLDRSDLFGDADGDGDDWTCLFATDWPMESLRPTRDAVMAVGDDTLELLSLSACASPAGRKGGGRGGSRLRGGGPRSLLDLCCGSGIQGIFAAACSQGTVEEVVATDVSGRAVRFAAASFALTFPPGEGEGGGGMGGGGEGGCRCPRPPSFRAVRGDLFAPLRGRGGDTRRRFGRILSNPPFVAVPSYPDHPGLQPALYAVGGGIDGMDVLRRIMGECLDFLADSGGGDEGDPDPDPDPDHGHDADYGGASAQLLMVTEVPNVRESCALLRSMLPGGGERDGARIRIAYVEADVETAGEYARVREGERDGTGGGGGGEVEEDGDDDDDDDPRCPILLPPHPTPAAGRDWARPMEGAGIRDRALVLISVARGAGGRDEDGIHSLGQEESGSGSGSGGETLADAEEDRFLTLEGVRFTRKALL